MCIAFCLNSPYNRCRYLLVTTLPLSPARRSLLEDKRGLGDDAKQALRAAARSGLELYL